MNEKVEIHYFVVGPFGECTYLVGDPETKQSVLIDPGDEAGKLLRFIQEEGWQVQYILNTHGHIDHIGAVRPLQDALQVPFGIHPKDQFLLEPEHLEMVSSFFGLPSPSPPRVDFHLKEGDRFQVGSLLLEVWEVPGHTPGHVCFLLDTEPKRLFVGDFVFKGSIGRTDLPGGDLHTLLQSIQKTFFERNLAEDTLLYPGHPTAPGEPPTTTVGREKQWNPFFQKENNPFL